MFLQDKISILNSRMAKFYYILFNLIAITIIVYIGIDAFYRVIRTKYAVVNTETAVPRAIEEETSSMKSSLSDYQAIIDRNIFSKNAVPAQQGDVDIDALKRTSLKLVLLGTIAGSKKTSAAFIQDTGTRTQGLYREGDTVQAATIKSILRNQVVLAVGNREELLTIEEAESGGAGTDTETAKAETASESAASAAAVERNITIKRADIDSSLKDLNELLSQASIQAHSTDGEPDGLTITGIKAGSIFRKMGLRNGDIIKGVNNDAIKTTEDLIGMYNDLKSAPDISIQITRRGQERSFNYSFTD